MSTDYEKINNHRGNRLIWVTGFVAISVGFIALRSRHGSIYVKNRSNPLTVAHGGIVHSLTTNDLVRKRVQSMGDLGQDGVILTSYEHSNGTISNVFSFSSGESINQIISLPVSDRWIGTKEYELIAEQDYQLNLARDPALADLKAIFEEFPPAKDSQLFYTGLRQVFVARSEILGVRRRRKAFEANDGDRENSMRKRDYLDGHEEARALFRDRLEQQSYRIRCHERLIQLYGRMPDEFFQRLMSVNVLIVPDSLPDLAVQEPFKVRHAL